MSLNRLIFTAFLPMMLLTPLSGICAANNLETSQGAINIKHLIESQIVAGESKVQIAEINVDPSRIEEFRNLVWTVGEISTQTEPGVLLLFSASSKENPARFVVVEVYKDQKAYQSHLKTKHFLDYKKGTEGLVKSLKLVQYEALSTQIKK